MTIGQIVNATKERIDAAAAGSMLKQHGEIVVAQRSKVLRFDPKKDATEDILKVIIGPSGNLRAPTLIVGKKLVVGFHEDMYTTVFS